MTALEDTLEVVNIIFGNDNTLPKTKYKIRKYMNVKTGNVKTHVYCSNEQCKKYLGVKGEKKKPLAKRANAGKL